MQEGSLVQQGSKQVKFDVSGGRDPDRGQAMTEGAPSPGHGRLPQDEMLTAGFAEAAERARRG